MKKILFFAAACAALAACNLSTIDKETPVADGSAFVKGQKVTLTVSACAGSGTKAVGALNATTNAIDFKWETGDKIKVTVGTESAEFTLSSGAGGTVAEFTGNMPGSGTTFSAQYPYAGLEVSALANQTYNATKAVPHDMMLATASGCTVGTPFVLQPQYAVLRLNMYGIERNVTQIVVTNTSHDDPLTSYTLSVSPAVTISSDASSPTPFFIVVDPVCYHDPDPEEISYEWTFNVAVASEASVTPSAYSLPYYPSDDNPIYGQGILITNNLINDGLRTMTEQTFTPGYVLNMPPFSLTTVWAPVNCGYDEKEYPYGKLYQFGRAVGCGYNDGAAYLETEIQSLCTDPAAVTSPDDDKFYLGVENDWYSGPQILSLWPMKSGDSGYIEGKIDNPCPAGWRVPTNTDLQGLVNNTSGLNWTTAGGPYNNQTGCIFGTSPNQVFLPAAGYRDTHGAWERNIYAKYWSSVDSHQWNNHPWYLEFGHSEWTYEEQQYTDEQTPRVCFDHGPRRCSGCSVRCIHD